MGASEVQAKVDAVIHQAEHDIPEGIFAIVMDSLDAVNDGSHGTTHSLRRLSMAARRLWLQNDTAHMVATVTTVVRNEAIDICHADQACAADAPPTELGRSAFFPWHLVVILALAVAFLALLVSFLVCAVARCRSTVAEGSSTSVAAVVTPKAVVKDASLPVTATAKKDEDDVA